jgi:hypothetical protein
MSIWFRFLLIAAGYVLVGLVVTRVLKQREFNKSVRELENCPKCMAQTKSELRLSWCRTHEPEESDAAGFGVCWPVALLFVLYLGLTRTVKKIMFPAGQVRNKRADLLLRELKLKRDEALVEQRQAEIEKQHEALGIYCQENFPGAQITIEEAKKRGYI